MLEVPSALAEVEHQTDIVDRSWLGPTLLAESRAVPIRVSASFVGGGGHHGGGSEVTLGSLQPNDDRPVLHEHMHVLDDRGFPGGFRDATVGRFCEEAGKEGLYPPDAHTMPNPAEFFAVTASCRLDGTVARDPYTRAATRERQPDYDAYLARVFGPRGDTARRDTSAAVADNR